MYSLCRWWLSCGTPSSKATSRSCPECGRSNSSLSYQQHRWLGVHFPEKTWICSSRSWGTLLCCIHVPPTALPQRLATHPPRVCTWEASGHGGKSRRLAYYVVAWAHGALPQLYSTGIAMQSRHNAWSSGICSQSPRTVGLGGERSWDGPPLPWLDTSPGWCRKKWTRMGSTSYKLGWCRLWVFQHYRSWSFYWNEKWFQLSLQSRFDSELCRIRFCVNTAV